jgi:hypothetical protein
VPRQGALDERRLYQEMRDEASQIPHRYPFLYFMKPYQLSNWHKAKFFIQRAKRFILQFVVLKIIAAAFLLLVYPNYEFFPRSTTDQSYLIYWKVRIALLWILGISSYASYYYLGFLPDVLKTYLQPFRPELKFTTIWVYFYFTFWQKLWFRLFQKDILNCFDKTSSNYRYEQIITTLEVSLKVFSIPRCASR